MRNPNPIPRNDPYLEKAVVALWYAEDACADFLEEHEDKAAPYACDCLLCEDLRGILFMVRHCEAIASSQMYGMPPKLRRLRAIGFPGAETFADMILSVGEGPAGEEPPEAV